MTDLTAIKILKENPLTQGIPIIAFTALVMESDKNKAFGAGCSGFISKPIQILTLLHKPSNEYTWKNKGLKNKLHRQKEKLPAKKSK